MKIDEKQLKAISEIKKFHQISEKEVKNLQIFVDLLLKFNQQFNLIGKSTIDDIWNRHILDSAQLLKFIKNKDSVIGDFGAGAGFPGIVLSILGVKEVHLIEKSYRKCEFLNLAKKTSPNNIVIHQRKVEEIKGLKFDILASRAFAPLNELFNFVKPFLKDSSQGIFLKGKNFQKEIDEAKKNHQFECESHPSLTSDESKILLISHSKV
jgi:16S rRNA (guanine527-N7)-methyltransferase